MSNELRVEIVTDFETVRNEWKALVPQEYTYLDPDYLRILQAYPPKGYIIRFPVFRRGNQIIGVGVLQFVHFRLDERLKHGFGPAWLKSWLKGWIVNFGNLTVTGERHFYFAPETTSNDKIFLLKSLVRACFRYKPSGKGRPSLFVLKEVQKGSEESRWIDAGFPTFKKAEVQPSMLFEAEKEWSSFEDYLFALKSKYRVTFRRYFSKGRALRCKELELPDMERMEERIFGLYQRMASKAGFNGFDLHTSYFTEMKRGLGARFRCYGIWYEGELVAFYTLLVEAHRVDAHFMGMDDGLRANVYLYNNILLDIVRRMFQLGKRSIHFSRTALESKSALGAKPIQFIIYFQYVSPLLNAFVGIIFRWLYPGEHWRLRHPFRTGPISSAPTV